MDLDEARRFVDTHHRAVAATYRADGGLQLSPVSVGPGAGGTVAISSREGAMKTRNLRRDPRISICVMSDEFYGVWVRLDGRAEVVPLPEAMEGLVDYYRALAGEHPDWADYRAAMERDRRVLIQVTVEAAGPTASG